MNKTQLKKALRPLVTECIKEVIFEAGVLSKIISEVISGTNAGVIKEATESKSKNVEREKETKKVKQNMLKAKKQLLEAVGKGGYNNIDVFEGTTPISTSGQAGEVLSPLSNLSPNDPGIDISSIPGMNSWKHLIK